MCWRKDASYYTHCINNLHNTHPTLKPTTKRYTILTLFGSAIGGKGYLFVKFETQFASNRISNPFYTLKMENIVQECASCQALFTAGIETPFCFLCTLGLQLGSPASSGSLDEAEFEEAEEATIEKEDNQQVQEHLEALAVEEEHILDLQTAYEDWQQAKIESIDDSLTG